MSFKDIYGVERLSYDEERNLLNALLEDEAEILGHGSSRIVVELNKDKVVKIALSAEGIAQNNAEYNCFCDGENQDHYVAEIYAMGAMVLISERLTPICDGSQEELDEWIDNLPEEKQDAAISRSDEVVDYLCSLFGTTDDNYQLGCNNDGLIMAYDYGFDSSSNDLDSIVGNIRDLYDEDIFEDTEDYIRLALEILPYACTIGAPYKDDLRLYFIEHKRDETPSKFEPLEPELLKEWQGERINQNLSDDD
jgi:hypothetical protein